MSPIKTLQVTWSSFVMTQVIFVAACWWALRSVGPTEGPSALVFAGAAIFAALALPIARRVAMGSVALTGGGARLLRAEPVSEELLDEALLEALNRYKVGTIVGLAVAEAVTLFGFAHAFTHGDWMLILPYALMGELLTLIQIPREGALEALLSEGEAVAFQRRREARR